MDKSILIVISTYNAKQSSNFYNHKLNKFITTYGKNINKSLVAGMERLKKQMMDEAISQLTANAEKIAAREGKGPSWEDKVRLSRGG